MYKAPRGTTDILPADQPYWRYVLDAAERLCRRYGYQRIDTPLFEDAGLFNRSIGAGTDIVEKETYSFDDRSGDRITLKPESTAAVCRAYLEHGMHALAQPVKLYYISPSFRYERPQAGRYRQFHQWGFEAIGESDPTVDAEAVSLAWDLYKEVGITGLTVLLNSIGDAACRPGYIQALVAYYRDHVNEVCGDCKVRLEKNPLRLLDCKVPQDQPIIAAAPKTSEYLCDPCKAHFAATRSYLDALGVPYTIEHKLVRGLDYYTRTVFEVVPLEKTGQQTAVGAGGRYDGLIEALDGKPTPGIGFAAGIERIVLNLKAQGVAVPNPNQPQVYIAHQGGDPARQQAVRLSQRLRDADVNTWLGFGDRSLKAQLRHANNMGVTYTVMIGENEVQTREVLLKTMATGADEHIMLEQAAFRIAHKLTGGV
ncbi:MAG: histidine--tRNA ligase [Dehalococcoidia bacterium]|nr:histidine--tRNA ligase [Dehalococcoidia bacterium]